MMRDQLMRRHRWIRVVVVIGFLSVSAITGRAHAESVQEAIREGVRLERQRQWIDAIEHYEDALETWSENDEIRYGLRRSKIQYHIDRRYSDDSFETRLLANSRQQSLELFDEVLSQVRSNYVDRISSTSFVAHGTESFYLALRNENFARKNLQSVEDSQIRTLRKILREQYWNKPVANQAEARDLVSEITELAENIIGVTHSAVVMEYVFGGCNALDDYSRYLTPERLKDLYGNIDGEFVGLGIEMKAESGRGMLLVNVLPNSPAEEGGLIAGDHIIGIDGSDCTDLSTDAAARLLRGRSGTTVRLTIKRDGREPPMIGTFTRRAVQVKSIPVVKIIDKQNGIGYIKMTGFQKTTATELDNALAQLRRENMQSLILDLRGNPGGLLTAAVEVLDRFISSGVLVSTRGRSQDQNWSYSAHQSGTLRVPLVLLIDTESASASEIVAGAIRDYRRGTIIGRKTYGKWSVQSIFTIRGATGLKLTTARFYSPNNHTYGSVGLKPDLVVTLPETQKTFFRGPLTVADLEDDLDVQKGLDVLRRQVTQR